MRCVIELGAKEDIYMENLKYYETLHEGIRIFIAGFREFVLLVMLQHS